MAKIKIFESSFNPLEYQDAFEKRVNDFLQGKNVISFHQDYDTNKRKLIYTVLYEEIYTFSNLPPVEKSSAEFRSRVLNLINTKINEH